MGTPANLVAAGAAAGRPAGGFVHRSLGAKPTNTAGVIEATTDAPGDLDLLVDRVFILTNSTTPTSVTVYVDDADPTNRRSYSDEGDLNELECSPPIWVPAGSTLRFVWEGGTAPAGNQLQAMANVQGRLIPGGA